MSITTKTKKAEELANQGYLSCLRPTIKECLDDRANIDPPLTYHSATHIL